MERKSSYGERRENMKNSLNLIFCIISLFSITNIFAKDEPVVFERDTLLTEDLVVEKGKTCIIKAGVKIIFKGYNAIIVRGLLMIEGTKELPVLITREDRARGELNWPGWKGFDIRGEEADAVIKNCRIEGAYRNIIYGTRPVLDSCEFVGNHSAIHCSGKAAPHIKNCRIYRNKYGLYVDHSTPIMLDNVITDNVIGVYTQMNSSMVAGRNIIEGNETDFSSEESLGENKDLGSLRKIWDIMRELY